MKIKDPPAFWGIIVGGIIGIIMIFILLGVPYHGQ